MCKILKKKKYNKTIKLINKISKVSFTNVCTFSYPNHLYYNTVKLNMHEQIGAWAKLPLYENRLFNVISNNLVFLYSLNRMKHKVDCVGQTLPSAVV